MCRVSWTLCFFVIVVVVFHRLVSLRFALVRSSGLRLLLCNS